MAFRDTGIGLGLILLLSGVVLISLALGLFGIQLLQAGGLGSGSILSVLGFALLYKGMSRKKVKEHL